LALPPQGRRPFLSLSFIRLDFLFPVAYVSPKKELRMSERMTALTENENPSNESEKETREINKDLFESSLK
jgi:hypothetical protein